MDKQNNVKKPKEFVCQMCGDKFLSFANHASYCKYCRDKRHLMKVKEHKARLESGETRKIGSEQVCPECGNTFILKSGNQKVCENCVKKHNNKTKSKANTRYRDKNYDACHIYVQKGKKDIIKKWAEGRKMSMNELFNKAIDFYMQHHEK